MSWYVVGGGFNEWLCEGGPVTGQGCFCKFDDDEHWDQSVISSLALMHYMDYHCCFGDGAEYSPASVMVCGIDETVAHTHYLNSSEWDNRSLCGLFYLFLGSLSCPTSSDSSYYVLGSPA